MRPRTEPPSYEIIDVAHGETGFSKSKSFNDRIVDFTFEKANTEYAIDIPMPDDIVPANFGVLSSDGSVYADAGCRSGWTPCKIVLKSTIAKNVAKVRIMF